jgi:hypothetical protein
MVVVLDKSFWLVDLDLEKGRSGFASGLFSEL